MERQTQLTLRATQGGETRVYLSSPKGQISGKWDGKQLNLPGGQVLRFTAETTERIDAAAAECRSAVYETRYGSQIEDGDREGWEFVTLEDDAFPVYQRLVSPSESRVVMIGRQDLA